MEINSKSDNISRWLGGIPYEVSFWESYYGNKRRLKNLFEWSNYNKPFELENFDIHGYIESLRVDKPLIMDVGCSLSYVMGNIIADKPRTITYVDPLAAFYNRILDRYKIDRPRIGFGMIETLSLNFERDSADFIHVRNALDHCANPYDGIVNCLEILKPGGVLYLNHHPNEAENENYRGFHQYNIIAEGGDLIIWNKETRLNVSQMLKGFASTEVSRSPEGNIVAIIIKTADLPPEVYSHFETTKRFAETLVTTMTYFHSFGNTTSYQFKRLYTSVGHKLMRILPFAVINKIKRLLSSRR